MCQLNVEADTCRRSYQLEFDVIAGTAADHVYKDGRPLGGYQAERQLVVTSVWQLVIRKRKCNLTAVLAKRVGKTLCDINSSEQCFNQSINQHIDRSISQKINDYCRNRHKHSIGYIWHD